MKSDGEFFNMLFEIFSKNSLNFSDQFIGCFSTGQTTANTLLVLKGSFKTFVIILVVPVNINDFETKSKIYLFLFIILFSNVLSNIQIAVKIEENFINNTFKFFIVVYVC